MAREPAKIHLVTHFHYDPTWIEDQKTYTNRALELVQQYLDACTRDSGYHAILSELDYLQPFLAAHGEHRQLLKDLVAEGRISTGGSYNEPNEMTIQGEPIIRNIVYGRLYHEGMLGARPVVYTPFDVFGHCVQLPQIAAKSGFEAIVWSKDIIGALPLCFGLAPDGTALPQKHEPYWYYPETFEEFLDTVANGLEHQAALGLSHDLRLFGYDMGEPRQWLIGRSQELAARDPRIVFGTPGSYLAAVAPELNARRAFIPTSARDLSFFHGGTLVSRTDLKMGNRLAENRLLGAETWATLASLLGAIYPDLALDKAWRQVLFNQHHDAITGCGSDVPYLDLLAGYREALDLAGLVEGNALAYIARRVGTAAAKRAPRKGAALLVLNPLGWERTDVCHARVRPEGPLAAGFRLLAEGGQEVPCQVVARSREGEEPWVEIAFIASAVPSLGYQTYFLAPADRMPAAVEYAAADRPTIENGTLSITADPASGGCLTSIYSKRLGKEFVNSKTGPANEVVALAEDPARESAPWELYTTGGVVRSSEAPARVEALKGPVFSRLRSTVALPNRCELVQEATVYQGLDRVDLRTTVAGYRGVHELLALTFPLDLLGAGATFEDRFAAVVRRPSAGKFDYRMFWHENRSRCGLGAAQNWVDVGPVPSLGITSGERTVGGVPLGPCSIVTSSDPRHRAAVRPLMEALLRRGVTCTQRLDNDDPEGDAAACAFRISLGRRNSYSKMLLDSSPQAASRLGESLSRQPWAGVLLRRPDPAGEWPDVPVLVADTDGPGGTTALAAMLAEAFAGDSLRLPESHDFSGLARPAESCGLALLNRGCIAASLENDGTLAAMLFHTTSWSILPWGEGKLDWFLVPEHRSQVFEHALWPHEGDWREGGVVRAGQEFNRPLRAVQAPISRGVLPTAFSLASVDAPNLAVAALKPVGNPLAERRAAVSRLLAAGPVEPGDDGPQGILLRLYECAGRTAEAVVTFAAPPEQAWLTDLMERTADDAEVADARWRTPAHVRLPVGPCDITSLAVRLGPLAEAGPPTQLGPTAEPYSPVHARWWDHNLGAAPMGNAPLSLWMRGPIPVGENTRFSLGISNETVDREITGSVEMIAPPEWTMIPRQIPYRIAPNSSAVYEVMVVVPEDAGPCHIRAVAKQGDYEVQEAIPVGAVAPLAAKLRRDGGSFVVELENPNAGEVEGHVTLVTPIESWGEAAGSAALCQVSPLLHPFRLGAGEKGRFSFGIEGEADMWAAARVAWYGNLQYVRETE